MALTEPGGGSDLQAMRTIARQDPDADGYVIVSWRTVGTPGGEIDALLPPAEMAGVEPVMRPVPAGGEHTEAVRAEFGRPEFGKDGSS